MSGNRSTEEAGLRAAETGVKYEYRQRVTYCHTNAAGHVSPDEYARLFGMVREIFGLDSIPRFKEEAGKNYILKTRNATYEFHRDFFFGDLMNIRMAVVEIAGASFTLAAEFVNDATGDIHAKGCQEIIYADMAGRPRRLSPELREVLNGLIVAPEEKKP
ncbi:MAG: thioesterase family protein [Deltaproteobacteria bacterium]|nr:thioesterase family protein [Deltaproteobacteria bacterium]